MVANYNLYKIFKMKNSSNHSYILSLISLVLVFVPVSCNKNTDKNSVQDCTSQLIKVFAEDEGAATKTTLNGVSTSWIAGTDKIGIFSDKARSASGGAGDIVSNVGFTAQSSAKQSHFTGTMYWGEEGASHTFFAYYPYATGTAAVTAVPVSLPSAQTQSSANSTAHIGALDFLVATPLTVTSPTGTDAVANELNLKYNHVFSIIEFRIKGSGTLSQVRLTGASPLACEGAIDLTQNPGSNNYTINHISTSNNVTVTLTTPVSLNSTTAPSVYMMVLPGTQIQDLQIAVNVNGSWNDMLKTQPTGGFFRGKKYVVSLNTEDGRWSTNVFTDTRDSKVYNYKAIGTQIWMTENLAYLPSVSATSAQSLTDANYHVYGYTGTDLTAAKATTNYTTYGVLYNWPAAMTACPTGWRLPAYADWITLFTYLGGVEDAFGWTNAGGKMKEAGMDHWTLPNGGATNESGFTGLPGGYRLSDGTYNYQNDYGFWWSATISGTDSNKAWLSTLYNMDSYARSGTNNKMLGLSVRCIKN